MTKEEFLQESSKYYTRQELADALGVRLSNLDFEKFKNLIYKYMHPSLLYKFGSR